MVIFPVNIMELYRIVKLENRVKNGVIRTHMSILGGLILVTIIVETHQGHPTELGATQQISIPDGNIVIAPIVLAQNGLLSVQFMPI